MHRFFQVTAFLLLALWLPAAQHCGLEASGLLASETSRTSAQSCCKQDGVCHNDGCLTVENGLVKPAANLAKAPLPVLFVCVCQLCLQAPLPATSADPALNAAIREHPLDWVPVWQFVQRAAPLSRAPSYIG